MMKTFKLHENVAAGAGILTALLLMPAFGGVAHAEWEFDHMEITKGTSYHRSANYGWNGAMDTSDSRDLPAGSPSDSTFSQQHGDSPPYPGPRQEVAVCSFTATPVFRWYDDWWDWDEETNEPIYPPVDTRPIWIYEKATMTATGSGNGATVDITAPEAAFRLGTPDQTNVPDDGDGLEPQAYYESSDTGAQPNGRTVTVTGQKFEKITPVGRWAYGQSRSFNCTVTASKGGFADRNETLSAFCGFSDDIRQVSFGLMVRPIYDDNDGGNTGMAQFGPGNGYNRGNANMAGGMTINAGGVDNFQHKCEVWMTIYPTPGGILPARYYPKVDLAYKNGKDVPAVFKPFTANFLTPTVTNWADYYQSYVGEIVSRDVTYRNDGGGWTFYPRVMLGYGGMGNPGCSVDMSWADTQWRMGQNGEKDWAAGFPMDGADYTETVWTKFTGYLNHPLTGHSMRYVPDRVVVKEENPETHEVITKIFTTNAGEVAQHADDPSYSVTYQDDITDVAAPYVTVTGGGALDANGVCTGQLTVKSGTNFTVQQYQLAVEDQGVFRKLP